MKKILLMTLSLNLSCCYAVFASNTFEDNNGYDGYLIDTTPHNSMYPVINRKRLYEDDHLNTRSNQDVGCQAIKKAKLGDATIVQTLNQQDPTDFVDDFGNQYKNSYALMSYLSSLCCADIMSVCGIKIHENLSNMPNLVFNSEHQNHLNVSIIPSQSSVVQTSTVDDNKIFSIEINFKGRFILFHQFKLERQAHLLNDKKRTSVEADEIVKDTLKIRWIILNSYSHLHGQSNFNLVKMRQEIRERPIFKNLNYNTFMYRYVNMFLCLTKEQKKYFEGFNPYNKETYVANGKN